jgi:predicted transcriptional regulator
MSMARRKRAKSLNYDRFLGPLELRIMEDLWDHGRSSVNDVLDRLNSEDGRSLVYNTVMSTLARLADKGFLQRERDGRAYQYRPVADRVGFSQQRAADMSDELIDDLGEAAVAGFVDSVRDRPEMLETLRRLMDSEDPGHP